METGCPDAAIPPWLALAAIGVLVAVYAASLAVGLPQRGTAAGRRITGTRPRIQGARPRHPASGRIASTAAAGHDRAVRAAARGDRHLSPGPRRLAHWWEHNLHKFYVAGGLAVLTLLYYLLFHELPIAGHFPAHHAIEPNPTVRTSRTAATVLANAMLGGVRAVHRAAVQPLHDQRRHSPRRRPAGLRPVDQYRVPGRRRRAGQHHRHHRRGDAADPPAAGNQPRAEARQAHGRLLHLRRLQLRRLLAAHRRSAAVPRLPAGRAVSSGRSCCGRSGCSSTCALLAIYFVWDHSSCYPHESASRHRARRDASPAAAASAGVWPNACLLLGVIVTVALLDPGQAAARHRLASVDVSARGRAVGAGGRRR